MKEHQYSWGKRLISMVLAIGMMIAMFPDRAVATEAKQVEKPICNITEFEYTGNTITLLSETEDYTVTDGEKTGVGSYEAVISLKEKGTTEWSTGGTDDITIAWTITPKFVTVPEAVGNLVYNGEEQTGVADGEGYTVTNGTATNAGTHTTTAELTDPDNYCWNTTENLSGDKNETVSIEWSIAKKTVTVPEAVGNLVYNGEEQTGVADGEGYTVTDGTATDAGTHSTTATLTDPDNYCWNATENLSGDKNETVSIGWSISVAPVEGFTVSPAAAQLTYNAEEQNLVQVSIDETKLPNGNPQDYTIQYSVDSWATWSNTVPTGKNANTYTVKVRIYQTANSNYAEYTDISGESGLAITIDKQPVAVPTAATALIYNGNEQTGVADGDVYTVTDGTATDAGTHTTTATLTDPDNYCWNTTENLSGDKNETVSIEWSIGKKTVTVPEAVGNLVYNGEEQTGVADGEGYTVVDGAKEDVGEYTAVVTLNSNYQWLDSNIDAKEISWSIAQETATPIVFTNEELTNIVTLTNAGSQTISFVADLTAGAKAKEPTAITYEVDDQSIATIDEKGLLTLLKEGCVSITATKTGDTNYPTTEQTYQLTIQRSTDELITLEKISVDYTLGANKGTVCESQAKKAFTDDNGELSYQMNCTGAEVGLSLDEQSGVLTIANYVKLANTLKNGPLTVEITASKTDGTVEKWGETHILYPATSKSYSVVLNFADVTNTYELSGEKASQESEWYISNVQAVPQSAYEVVREENFTTDGTGFASSVTYGELETEQGIHDYSIYVKNTKNGTIGYSTISQLHIDTVKPNEVSISYSLPINKPLNFASDRATAENAKDFQPAYYSDTTKITIYFRAYDAVSGIDQFDWSYARFTNASTSNLIATSGEVKATAEGNGWYKGEITLPADEAFKALHGNLTVTASDVAGNKSKEKTDSDYTFVYDETAPKCSTAFHKVGEEYSATNQGVVETVGTKHYFDGAVQYTIAITEINFEESDVNVEITKDGEVQTGFVVNWVKDNQTQDTYVATVTFQEDGDYQVRINYTDLSGNIMTESLSDVIVVDTTKPEREANFHKVGEEYSATNQGIVETVGTKHYFDGAVQYTVAITEHNFNADYVTFTVKRDGEIYAVAPSWIDTGDLHTATFTLGSNNTDEDGDYQVEVTCKDYSGNEMITILSDTIVVDTNAPAVTMEYLDTTDKTHPQTLHILITDRNIRFDELEVIQIVTDITGETLSGRDIKTFVTVTENWKDTMTAYQKELYLPFDSKGDDGIYEIELKATDIANRETMVTLEKCVVDHCKPTDVTISYSDAIHQLTDNNGVTRRFYNHNNDFITVTFTTKDKTAGVARFQFDVQKESTAVDTLETFKKTLENTAIQQSTEDKTLFTASIVLPENAVEQLRSSIVKVVAEDACNNKSEEVSDDKTVIVADNTAPVISISGIDKEQNNGSVSITVSIREENFYEELTSITDGTKALTPSWSHNGNVHTATFTISDEGEHTIYVTSKDYSGNNSQMKSSSFIIDTTKPVIRVDYQNTDVVRTETVSGGEERYFNATQTAHITVEETYFQAGNTNITIHAYDVSGAELNTKDLISESGWNGNSNTITFHGDAHYTFTISTVDAAGNISDPYETDYFVVDTTAPENLTISFSEGVQDMGIEGTAYRFYNGTATVTVSATDVTSGVEGFTYSYTKAEGVSPVNAELIQKAVNAAEITYSDNRKTATIRFQIPFELLTEMTQFNGGVSFQVVDMTGNQSEQSDAQRLVVDSVAPVVNVTFSEPVQNDSGIAYYSGSIQATISVVEANFFAEDVYISVSKDGGAFYAITPQWSSADTDHHTGTFVLDGDGDYLVSVFYQDRSGNAMQTYTSHQLTIDTIMESPVVTINGNGESGMAYKDEVVANISFGDQNFDSYTVTLLRTRMNEKDVDVTEEFITGLSMTPNGGSGSFDTFAMDANNDGIYTLTVSYADKAGHTSESVVIFTVNRYGSVYAYNDYLIQLIANGGAYVANVTEDLVIDEYNADRLVADTLEIEITRDGRPLDKNEMVYTISPQINEFVTTGDSGWFQYRYVIDKSNFAEDGIYKISIASKDSTGNMPENTNYEDKAILFRVDHTKPEIVSVVGMEEAIVNAKEHSGRFTIYDAIGLKSIQLYINGEPYGDAITDFGGDCNNYEGSYTLTESSTAQTVRIVVEDLAGNITDTAAEDFVSAFPFVEQITVSTSGFVRWYANKPLFYGTVGGTVTVGVGLGVMLSALKKKRLLKEAAEVVMK